MLACIFIVIWAKTIFQGILTLAKTIKSLGINV